MSKYGDWTRGEDEALLNKLGGVEIARDILKGTRQVVVNVVELAPPPTIWILEFVGMVTTSATTEKFVARDKFKLKREGGICSCIGTNFTEYFLSGDGKTEDPIGEQTLRYAKLRRAATDMPQKPGQPAIIPELGGEAKAETALTEIYDRMAKQTNGEAGALLTNGYANIFYVRDQSGVLRSVRVVWVDDGWLVFANSFEHPDERFDGYQVFFRNSVLMSSDALVPASA